MRRHRAGPASGELDANVPLAWNWPTCPGSLTIYDKYSDEVSVVRFHEPEWIYTAQGRQTRHKFSRDEAVRELQQTLIMLTQQAAAPSAVRRFSITLLSGWGAFYELLAAGPSSAKRLWAEQIVTQGMSWVGKAVLKVACNASMGPWRHLHWAMVKSLDAHARPLAIDQQAKLKRREKLLSIEAQAAITHVLDQERDLTVCSEDDLEGLAALGLVFQHGVRPVQLLALRLEHVDVHYVGGQMVCIIAFHAAKQSEGNAFEIPRQVKPEWTGPVAALREEAIRAGRNRLFNCITSEQLWTRVARISGPLGKDESFKAGWVRHTAAQALADAGHDRDSIRQFLGQSSKSSANAYVQASRKQADLINRALGASRLYTKISAMAAGEFITLAELIGADEDKQIGGVVGGRLVAGIGLCRTGQSHCSFNPVTSCYGCPKFVPSLDRASHVEAITGMREQVAKYLDLDREALSPAAQQLTRALSVAQKAVAVIDSMERPQ